MHRLTLYTTEGCHLCEEAEALLRALGETVAGVTWIAVDIANDDTLFKRYGWSIPVLKREDGGELAWPFDAGVLRAFIKRSDLDSPVTGDA